VQLGPRSLVRPLWRSAPRARAFFFLVPDQRFWTPLPSLPHEHGPAADTAASRSRRRRFSVRWGVVRPGIALDQLASRSLHRRLPAFERGGRGLNHPRFPEAASRSSGRQHVGGPSDSRRWPAEGGRMRTGSSAYGLTEGGGVPSGFNPTPPTTRSERRLHTCGPPSRESEWQLIEPDTPRCSPWARAAENSPRLPGVDCYYSILSTPRGSPRGRLVPFRRLLGVLDEEAEVLRTMWARVK